MRQVSWQDVSGIKIPDEESVGGVLCRINILDLISPHVVLKQQRNGEHRGLCPFHSEKTPSFYVNENKGVYRCWGCNESGNAISWLIKYDGMTKAEAIRSLMIMAGMDEMSDEEDMIRKARMASKVVIEQAHSGDDSKDPDFIFWDISDVCGEVMKMNPDDDALIEKIESILRAMDDMYHEGDEKGLIILHEVYPGMLERKTEEDSGCEGEDS